MTSESQRIEHLFDTAEARFDDWRGLLKASQLWAARVGTKEATGLKSRCAAQFGEMLPIEDFHAYPGARLLATLKDRIDSSDAVGVSRLVQRISSARVMRSYRRDAAEWESRSSGSKKL